METYDILGETSEPENEYKKEDDKTFNRIKKIQSQLKRGIALNEKCK